MQNRVFVLLAMGRVFVLLAMGRVFVLLAMGRVFVLLAMGRSETQVPYFFGYKMELLSFKNNPKDLDPSYQIDLDLWDCLGRLIHI